MSKLDITNIMCTVIWSFYNNENKGVMVFYYMGNDDKPHKLMESKKLFNMEVKDYIGKTLTEVIEDYKAGKIKVHVKQERVDLDKLLG